MAILKGTGLSRRGWRHGEDGSATATLWWTVAYLPLIPLRRHRVQLVDAGDAEGPGGPDSRLLRLLTRYAFDVPVSVRERLPLSGREILGTLVWTYVLVPLLCIWPVVLWTAACDVYAHATGRERVDPPIGVLIALAVVQITMVVVVLLKAVQRARGVPPRPRASRPRRRERGGEQSGRRPSLDERYPVGQRGR